METITFHQVVPIFRIFDVARAKEFYGDFLGFQIDWEHRFGEGMPLYMQVSRGGLVLHLSEHHGDCTPGATAFVRMSGVKDFHADVMAKGYKYNFPGLGCEAGGHWEMEVIDPFGNRLRFQERAESTTTGAT